MNLFFFAINQSPFIVELVDTLYNYLPDCSSVKIILQTKLGSERSHWGLKKCKNPIEIIDMPHDVCSFLDAEKPDCIIFTGYRMKEYMTVKKWSKNNHVRFFINCSEKITEYKQHPMVVWLKYKYFQHRVKGVNGMMAISNRAMERYQKYSNVPTIVIPYTFDMNRLLGFDPLAYDGSNLTFLISGRLEQFRDPIYSIKLYADIRRLRPNIKTQLIISGKGSLYNDILKLIKELGIEDETIWMNDFNKWEEIHEIYKKAHILLCYQEYGGWGLIVPEAMAAGLLVACSSTVDSGDNCIIDGFNGLLCNRVDYQTSLNSLLSLIDDPERFNYVRKNAKESAKYGDVNYYAKRLAHFIQSY